jgi:hypothetical protein
LLSRHVLNLFRLSQPEAKLYRKLLVAICNQKYAEMPFLFERISDYTELLLPDDLLSDQSFVSDIRNGMTGEDCQNVELLGWLYQFYITDRKADAEVKKTKKGGLKSDEQAAATQLFTPHWVVRYMVENSLGRIWMTLHPESKLIEEMPYYIPTPEGQTDPIPEDIKTVADIRFIDPCMGSGHVLVYAFDLLAKMYEEEGYESRRIPASILTNNIFGIDIDRRCYQLASFALSMKARAYYSRYLRKAVQLHTIALQNIDHDTISSAGSWDAKSSIWQFENVDTIGSLLQITVADCDKIKIGGGLFGEQQEILKTQAEYLSRKYHCVVTNPPYLGKGMGGALKNYVLSYYPNSKSDTMATFMERAFDFCIHNGKIAMINMQSWMFLSSYEKLRNVLLENYNIDSLLHLGPHAFDEIGGEVVQCATFTLANHKPSSNGGIYFRLIDGKNSGEKESAFLAKSNEYKGVNQTDFEKIPGSSIGFWASSNMVACFEIKHFLNEELDCLQGIITGNTNKYLRIWSEINYNNLAIHSTSFNDNKYWISYTKGGEVRKWYGNNEYVIFWVKNGEYLVRNRSTNAQYYLKPCFTWSLIGSKSFSTRYCDDGFLWDVSGSIGVPNKDNWKTLLGFMNTKLPNKFLNILNPTINTNIEDVNALPICYNTVSNDTLENTVQENINISKLDWDSHETSWDFKENELIRVDREETDLHDGKHLLLELVCEYYKSYWECNFNDLHENEEELNRQFIEIYGLQDELTPDVPLSEITILQKGEINIENNEIVWHEDIIIKQFISYLVGCFMGRYSIDRPGLIIASQHQGLNALGLKVEGIDNNAPGRLAIDDDGIVPVIEEEDFFDDDMTQRIEQAIKVIFGEENYHANLKYINEKLGKPLREYLFKDFFADHIDGKMYQKRPYLLVILIQDG